MGIRFNLGTGYGILLSKKQRKALDRDKINAVMEKYFDGRINRSYAWSIQKEKPVAITDESAEEIDDAISYMEYIDFDASKKEGKLVIKHGDVQAFVRDEFIFPADEGGTKSFFGFINDVHHNSDTCCAILYPLELLGVKCDYCVPFEFLIPVNDKNKPLSIENTGGNFPLEKSRLGGAGNEYPKFVPGVEYMLMSDVGKDYLKIVEKANADKSPIPFQTREECDEFVTTWLKMWDGVTSVLYRRGLKLVNVFYPEVKMKDIERYIVGRWS